MGILNMRFESTAKFAKQMDEKDPLSSFRKEFLFPKTKSGDDFIYMAGNSLGLQPKKAKKYIEQELEDWARFGVEGHFHAKYPWLPYHENLTDQTARLVGAKPIEVVVMNTLTVNLHLMMVSFYRPTSKRFKILIEGGAFPSDQYAVVSQIKFHGFDPSTALVELYPRKGEATLRPEDILAIIEQDGESIALILLGNVNYLTGQAFDMKAITEAGHKQGCRVGFDLAHGAGNLECRLHDWEVDFAVWCGYKYLNGGPGALSGCFIHENHARNRDLPRFGGWWGHNKKTRFQMGPFFDPIPGAEGWQLSNPPIFQLAALRASLEVFDKATMPALRKKSELLTGYLEYLLDHRAVELGSVITPRDPKQRGSQLSIKTKKDCEVTLKKLQSAGVICDSRKPDIIRIAPTPLYTRFSDVFKMVQALEKA
jgi:kynureninase